MSFSEPTNSPPPPPPPPTPQYRQRILHDIMCSHLIIISLSLLKVETGSLFTPECIGHALKRRCSYQGIWKNQGGQINFCNFRGISCFHKIDENVVGGGGREGQMRLYPKYIAKKENIHARICLALQIISTQEQQTAVTKLTYVPIPEALLVSGTQLCKCLHSITWIQLPERSAKSDLKRYNYVKPGRKMYLLYTKK